MVNELKAELSNLSLQSRQTQAAASRKSPEVPKSSANPDRAKPAATEPAKEVYKMAEAPSTKTAAPLDLSNIPVYKVW